MTATSADTVTMRSPTGSRPSAPSTRPNASWRRALRRVALVELGGNLDRRGLGGRRGEERRQPLHELGLRAARRERRPTRRPARDAERLPQLVDLALREERAVIERIAGERKPPALDGVGEDDARAGRARCPAAVEASGISGEVVAADVGHAARPARRRARRRAAGRAPGPIPPAAVATSALRAAPGGRRSSAGTPRCVIPRAARGAARHRAARSTAEAAAPSVAR